jgi:hypothetical protein
MHELDRTGAPRDHRIYKTVDIPVWYRLPFLPSDIDASQVVEEGVELPADKGIEAVLALHGEDHGPHGPFQPLGRAEVT